MVAQIIERFRNETEVGVPRRFSIGQSFVLLTVFAVLFRVLALIGFDTTWTVLAWLFFTIVTFAQALLFQGVRPRAASILAGSLAAPFLLILICLDERLTGWSSLTPIEWGLFRIDSFLAFTVFLAVAGAGAGYVVGGTIAGVFYVLGIRQNDLTETKPSADRSVTENCSPRAASLPPQGESRFLNFVSKVGSWLNPAPHGTPIRGAIAVFEICLLIGFVAAPFLQFFASYQQVWIGAAILGLAVAFWIGNFQLLLIWPIVLGGIGYLMAPQIYEALSGIAFFKQCFGQEALLRVIKVVSAGAGTFVSALAGWLQWVSFQKSERKRFGFLAFAAGCSAVFVLGLLTTQQLKAVAQRPTQLLLSKISAENDWRVGFNGMDGGSIRYVDFTPTFGDNDFLLLRPALSQATGISFSGTGFTDASIAALEGMNLKSFSVDNVRISDDAFDGLNEFSTSYLAMTRCNASPKLFASLLDDTTTQNVLNFMSFIDVELTPELFEQLKACNSLEYLFIQDCKVDRAMIEQLAGFKSLLQIQFTGGGLSDDEMTTFVSALPKTVGHLILDSNDLSDQGLLELAKCKKLRLSVKNNPKITKDGVEAFRRLNPISVVQWSDPEDE